MARAARQLAVGLGSVPCTRSRRAAPLHAGGRGRRRRGVSLGRWRDASLKWPNDLLVGERKLAGVLAESAPADVPSADRDSIAVVVGIGLNVNWPRRPPR